MRHNLALPDSRLDGAEGISISMLSGLVTGVAAGGDLAAIRNIDSRPLCVRLSRIRWLPTTAFGTAQAVGFHVHKVYGFSAVHTGGTPTAIQAHHYHAAGIAGSATGARVALTEISSVMATTGALTTATYTAPDGDEPEQFSVGATGVLPSVVDDYEPVARLPWVLGANEGLVLQNSFAMGASGVGRLFWAVDAYRLG